VHWGRSSDAVLITSAPQNPDHEFIHRRRRYTAMMALRVVCLLGAVCTYTISIWIALALVVGGAALPWCAVLIANDGPPRPRRPNRPLAPVAPSPPAPAIGSDQTIDG
jgi:Protein of unknown function (DUF3099)